MRQLPPSYGLWDGRPVFWFLVGMGTSAVIILGSELFWWARVHPW